MAWNIINLPPFPPPFPPPYSPAFMPNPPLIKIINFKRSTLF